MPLVPFGSSAAPPTDASVASVADPNPIHVAVSVSPDLAPPAAPPATVTSDPALVAQTPCVSSL